MKVTHLQRPFTELTACGERGPLMTKTFDTAQVTCAKCKRRMPAKFHAPPAIPKTAGRVVQPGGGHRR